MSEKKYMTDNGLELTLYQMVNLEPEWAVNRIRVCERLEAENKELKESIALFQECETEYDKKRIENKFLKDAALANA